MDRLDTREPHAPTTADALAQRATSCFAALRLLMPDATSTPWLPACYQLTARVEVVSSSLVLLDLGHCTPQEALAAMQTLQARLGALVSALTSTLRVGLAPSLTLAQLTLAQTIPAQPLRLLTPAEAPAFLQRLPVTVLAELRTPALPPDTIVRLQRYGLRTLGQVARLGDVALRRQFGAEVGEALSAVVTGRDPRPLCPTPPPPTLALRLRVPADGALPPKQVFALVPLLAAQATTLLRQAHVQAQALRLTVRWEGREAGTHTEASSVLSQPTDEHAPLTSALRRLLEQLVERQRGEHQMGSRSRSLRSERGVAPETTAEAAQEGAPRLPLPAITGLRLMLAELHPLLPAQSAFWRTRAQTLATTAQVAETLTCRYGRVLLTRPRLAVPAAIFHEERYRLTTRDATPDDAAETTETASIADAASASPPSPDAPWRQVPPRLHWG